MRRNWCFLQLFYEPTFNTFLHKRKVSSCSGQMMSFCFSLSFRRKSRWARNNNIGQNAIFLVEEKLIISSLFYSLDSCIESCSNANDEKGKNEKRSNQDCARVRFDQKIKNASVCLWHKKLSSRQFKELEDLDNNFFFVALQVFFGDNAFETVSLSFYTKWNSSRKLHPHFHSLNFLKFVSHVPKIKTRRKHQKSIEMKGILRGGQESRGMARFMFVFVRFQVIFFYTTWWDFHFFIAIENKKKE